MPRRHNRDDQPQPLTITPADIPRPRPIKSAEQARAERDEREAAEWKRKQERRRRDRNEALDWDTCLVPLCDDRVMSGLPKDAEIRIPLCLWHEAMVWRTVQRHNGKPEIYEATKHFAAEERKREEDEKRQRLARQSGHIYYVRLNGLIKVGWSRDVHQRLRAYGPDVEILCTHKGTRQDETTLHRNLRPFLARGREWYEDCPAMQDIVAQAVQRHGRGHILIEWTRPVEPPIRVRRR